MGFLPYFLSPRALGGEDNESHTSHVARDMSWHSRWHLIIAIVYSLVAVASCHSWLASMMSLLGALTTSWKFMNTCNYCSVWVLLCVPVHILYYIYMCIVSVWHPYRRYMYMYCVQKAIYSTYMYCGLDLQKFNILSLLWLCQYYRSISNINGCITKGCSSLTVQ